MKSAELKKLFSIYSIDYRSFISFRIVLGVILFFEALTKASNNLFFYTDLGAVSRGLAISELSATDFSFHLISGNWWFSATLFTIQVFLALFVLFGWHTKSALFITWLWIVSLQARNGIILNAGDALLRVLLFWSLFLPLEKFGTFDSWKKKSTEKGAILSLATAAILLQILFMYFFTALLKDHPIWTKDKTAVYYALHLKQFITSAATYTYPFENFLKFLTSTTLYLELFGPIILIIPYLGYWLRIPIALAFVGMHASFIVLMYLGLFPQTCIMAWLLFVPTYLWNYLEKYKLYQAFLNYLKEISHRIFQKIQNLDSKIKKYIEIKFFIYFSPPKKFVNFLIVYFFTATLLWNLSFMLPNFPVPALFRYPALLARLDQHWNMFAPYPMKIDAWYVAEAKLRNGKEVDLFTGEKVSWEMPPALFEWYGDSQWRKYFTNVWQFGSNKEQQLAHGRFLCRRWNDLEYHPYDEQVVTYKLYMMKSRVPDPGETPAPAQKELVWSHECFAPTST